MTFNEWIQTRWRPITAIVYLVICVFDFMVFPVFWSLFLYFSGADTVTIGWDPLTLQGAGMFHLSFGAILGVSAYTRGQEKLRRIEYGDYREDDHHSHNYEEPQRRRHFDPPVRRS